MTHEWPKVPLAEVIEPSRDEHLVLADSSYPNIGIYSFGRGIFEKPPIEGATTSARTLFRIRAKQFIYSRLFAFEGAYGLVPEAYDGAFVSNEFPSFDVDRERLCPDFLALRFKLPSTWKALAARTVGMGDRRQRIKPDQLLSYEIPLPPLTEQQRIVGKVERFAAKIDEARGLHDEIAKSARATLRSEFSRIASGAQMRPMGEVAPLVRRPVGIAMDATYPELGIRSFGQGTFHKPELTGFEVGSKKLFQIHAGDLLFNIVFAWEGAVAVAQSADHKRFGSHRFLTCVPREDMATSEFLCFYFLTQEGLENLGQASPGGAGRNRTLGLKFLERIEVPIPSIEQQLWFDGLQAKVDRLKALQAQTRAEFDALLPSILDRAFKGEL